MIRFSRAAIAALGALLCLIAAARADDRPSFLVIVADDMSRLDFRRFAMPQTFARIVDHGGLFTRFHVNTPVCGPSRATFWTGQYPHNHGYMNCDDGALGPITAVWHDYHRAGGSAREIGPVLQAAGYYTAAAGKTHSTYGQISNMKAAGLTESWTPPGYDDYTATTQPLYFNVRALRNNAATTLPGYASTVLRQHASAAIDSAMTQGKPFFIAYMPFNPHSSSDQMYPSEIENEFADVVVTREPDHNAAPVGKHPKLDSILSPSPMNANQVAAQDTLYRKRLRSLLALDVEIAALLDKLESAGRLSNTYVIVTSDNGYKLGHWRQTAKFSPWGRDVHVPFAVRGPGIVPGARWNHPISMVDVAPTIYALAGVGMPTWVDGRSFAGVIANPSLPWPPAFMQHWMSGRIHMHAPEVMAWRWRALADRRWRYIRWDDGFEEYYATDTDPFELVNAVATLAPERLAELRTMIEARSVCSGATC